MNGHLDLASRLEFLWNPHRREPAGMEPPLRAAFEFHRRLPGYRPTRLIQVEELASEFALERVWVKDESLRLGLPAFKILGVSWAAYRALAAMLGTEPDWHGLEDLKAAFASLLPLTLVSATSGNHGRAVARIARWFGFEARVFVPRAAPMDRVLGIRDEGADVVEVDGSYDDAVEAASMWVDASPPERALLISDAAISPTEQVPAWICEGYSTLFWEIDAELQSHGEASPDLVIVQIGVGSLAAAAATHFRRSDLDVQPVIVGVEPLSAACLLESARVGEARTVDGPHDSIMFCLNAGRPTAVGLHRVLTGFDAFAAIGDEGVGSATRSLARSGIVAGPTGTAGLVGLRQALPLLERVRPRRVLLLNTEGGADPTGYARALQSIPTPASAAGGC
jgi:diaminopropionate ammonia-lyase